MAARARFLIWLAQHRFDKSAVRPPRADPGGQAAAPLTAGDLMARDALTDYIAGGRV